MTARRLSRIVLATVMLVGAGTAAAFGYRASAAVNRERTALATIAARRPTELLQMRAAEDARLHAGPVSIEQAIGRLAERGRDGLGSELAPEQSNDTAPLMGWGLQPHDVPDWVMATPADAGGPGR